MKTKEEEYLEGQGLERKYGVIEITFEGLEEHLKMFNYIQSKELLEFAQEMVERYPNSPWITEHANKAIKKATS